MNRKRFQSYLLLTAAVLAASFIASTFTCVPAIADNIYWKGSWGTGPPEELDRL